MASTRYATIAVTKPVRAEINSYTAWLIGITGRRLSNSEALAALLTIARQYPDAITAALDTDAD